MHKVYTYICLPPGTSQKEAEHAKEELNTKAGKYQFAGSTVLFPLEAFLDFHPGNTFDRPNWKILKDKLQENDRVVVESLESFSKATFRITLNEIEKLRKRNIEFIVENLQEDPLNLKANVWDFVGDLYDYFEQIRFERQGSAIASIAANAVLRKEKYPGRKTVLDKEFLEQLQDLLTQNITSPSELSRKLKKSRSTIYKALKLLQEQEKFS